MNEKIKQLAEQVGLVTAHGMVITPEDLERFAELIVEECEDVLSAEFDQYESTLSPGDLNKHFGIKQ